MPVQYLSVSPLSSAIASETSQIRIQKNISKPGRLETKTSTSIGQVVRVRNTQLQPCQITSLFSGTLKRKLMFPVGTMATKSVGEVRFFLTVAPVAPPSVTIYRASVDELLIGSASLWRSSRIIKGDLVPISFKVIGQKLSGLFAEFTFTRKDSEAAAPIVKVASAIHLTSPVLDENTRIETMMGSFAIEPGDTANFPDREVELSYRLRLLDGIGRVYTVECGSFTSHYC